MHPSRPLVTISLGLALSFCALSLATGAGHDHSKKPSTRSRSTSRASYSYRPAPSLPSSDQAAITAQRTCLVSGRVLGSMGTPIKLTVRSEDVYVCCSGCVPWLQREPDKYLASLRFSGARLAQKSDENAIAAQGKCPVTDQRLGQTRTPWVVNVKSRDVLLCCRACTAKLQTEPDKYLAKLPPLKAEAKTMK